MTLNQLLYFQKISKYENYHKAAEELYVSQPSLSRSMASLENELGVLLFEKNGRGIVLTKAGEILLEYADRILTECDVMKNKMREIAEGNGLIDIGYIFPLAGHYVPHKVRKFLNQKGNEKVIFNFYQNHTPAIVKKLKSGELDVGFGAYMENEEELEFFPILSQEMVIITPKEHELKELEELSIKVLREYPVIGYDRSSGLGKYTKRLYKRLNMRPEIVVECPDEHSIAALVGESFGIALVPKVDGLEDANVTVHRINDIQLMNRNFMIWMKDRYQLPAVERFISYMKEQADIQE